MGTPDNTDTQEKTYQERVNEVVGQFQTDDNGKLSLPDGVEVDEGLLFAAKTEKRYRDTQSAFTKSQQSNKVLAAQNEKFASAWEQDFVKNLSSDEQTTLEELKTQDPEAWRVKISEIEDSRKQQLAEKRRQIEQESTQTTELEQRQQQLAAFLEANPSITINDEVLENDIPPRITKKLEKGEITFNEFLDETKTYLEKTKVVKPAASNPDEDEPNFAGSRGSHQHSGLDSNTDSTDYDDEIF